MASGTAAGRAVAGRVGVRRDASAAARWLWQEVVLALCWLSVVHGPAGGNSHGGCRCCAYCGYGREGIIDSHCSSLFGVFLVYFFFFFFLAVWPWADRGGVLLLAMAREAGRPWPVVVSSVWATGWPRVGPAPGLQGLTNGCGWCCIDNRSHRDS